ncbi:MoaF-related domain-containing protein [Kribbella deserti]|uniref:MoaF C-terminal domain-containing protein n=1 Tax=Kribbella deserti TaxID=1926257 RepID=A0ABV6R0M2_9ACTN
MKLIGHRVRVSYDSGAEYQVEYLSADKLRWSAVAGPTTGNSGIEEPTILELRDGVYWLNWLEADGTSISQVLDLNDLSLSEFSTYTTDTGDREKSFQQPAVVVLEQ